MPTSKPSPTPLSHGQRYVDEQREAVDGFGRRGEPRNGSTRYRDSTDRRGERKGSKRSRRENGTDQRYRQDRSPRRRSDPQHDADTVLVGWRGQPVHYRDVVVGNLVDTIATEATCDVLVERIEEPGPSESVLLPTAGGPHAACAAEIAGSLARANGASIEAIRVVPRDASEDDRAAAETTLDPVVEELPDVETATTVVESEEVITVITDRSRGHDFTLVGATHQRVLRQFVFGAVPEEVGRQAENTVIMPKRDLGITSRLHHRFGRG